MRNKNHNVVIMDGTNKNVVKDIMHRMRYVLGGRGIQISHLDEEHPNMIVLAYRGSTIESWDVEEEVNLKYPALCSFDAAV